MSDSELTGLTPGQQIIFGGTRVTTVDADLAANFQRGDHLIVVQATGDLIHVPSSVFRLVDDAVTSAVEAFALLASCADEQISCFFDEFARRLGEPAALANVMRANADDVDNAHDRGRSTTRLALDSEMLSHMVAGLLTWRDLPLRRQQVVDTVAHTGWSMDVLRGPLGVVGFVFEGRPNVFADACGVLRTGNTVVLRIGSDALATARAIMEHALAPALAAAGLPNGAVQLIESPTHAAGYALFSDTRLSIAVARGSGAAVRQLGAVAVQSGIAASLHGTGGAWIIAASSARTGDLAAAVENSLDRKVCNTVNVIVVVRENAAVLLQAVFEALDKAAARQDTQPIVHVVTGSEAEMPSGRTYAVISESDLGVEWEWERAPEVSLVVAESIEEAVDLFNRHSPKFVATLVSDDISEHDNFYSTVDAPFVGNGFTRWVDGQYALDRPELGLSNWEFGRLFGRGAILSGDSIHTIRHRVTVKDPNLRR